MSNLRQDLFELSAEHRLDAAQAKRLQQLAGLGQEPAVLGQVLPRGLLILAAALAALGVVMWIAANWDLLGRAGKFALLQAVLLAAGGVAAFRPKLRSAMGLLALLDIGALFAYFGQTYQTGADAWQLFALWAALAVPLALAARSDVVWTPWALVATVAVAFWVQTHTGHRWRLEAADLPVHLLAFGVLLLLNLALSPRLAQWTGAGLWAQRSMAVLSVTVVVLAALAALFESRIRPQYGVGLAALGAALAFLTTRRGFEVFSLSAVALGLDTLLWAGVVRWLFHDRRSHGDPIGEMLLLGLLAAALLAASVQMIMHLARRDRGSP